MEVFIKSIISGRQSCLAHEHSPAIRIRTWKKIAHAFGIHINPHTSLQNLFPWDAGWTSEDAFCEGLQEQAARLLAHLFVLESELGVPGAAARITYWNITSLTLWDTPVAQVKLRIVGDELLKGVVCLAETQWRPEDLITAAQRFPMTQVLGHPADKLAQPGSSGGVVALIPTFLGYEAQEIELPGHLQQYSSFILSLIHI